MDILLAMKGADLGAWMHALQTALPDARLRAWQPGDTARADYLLYWKEHPSALLPRDGLKAVFNMGAGVDALLDALRNHPGTVAGQVPVLRLEDAGMARQMVQYALYYAFRYQRRFYRYEAQARDRIWQPVDEDDAASFTIGVLGAGQLGLPVAQALAGLGFPVRIYSRSRKAPDGIAAYAGPGELLAFASGAKMLVNLLPNTPETQNILGRHLFAAMARGGYLVNLARGQHLVDADLLAALDDGQISRAALDVFREEPLPADHRFWNHPHIDITPHVSAQTLVQESVTQIVDRISAHLRGEPLVGIDLARGY